MREDLPEKQGLKLIAPAVSISSPAMREDLPEKQGLKHNSLLQPGVPDLNERGSSRKTRIETSRRRKSESSSPDERGSSRKTRIETNLSR